MTWKYDVTQLPTDPKTQARFLIGDTNQNDQQLQDEEIDFALQVRSSIWGAAAICCGSIAANASRRADTSTGELRTHYSEIARAYFARSAMYEAKSAELGGALPFVGGISVDDKMQAEMDPDRVPPDFNRGLTDNNNYPISPAGNEPSVAVDTPPNVV
jgi:hypothetical protein